MDSRPTERDPFIGRMIGPSYSAIRRIGAGGMGAVYEARNPKNNQRVAIKVLNRELAQDPMLLERFRREAKITASFDNPHVVKVLEFSQLADGVPYMVMEFLEGEDLEARLKRQKRLGPGEALELMRGMVAALAEAHSAGIIHRDIKPANLFYAREGVNERIKLLDFGVSKARSLTGDGLTVSGQMLGTVWYMSPEQGRGEEPTPASDVYSLAVVLYEALAGELPYVAASMPEYLFMVQRDAPRPILSVAPDLPLSLEGIFTRALARDPRARTSSVKFFAEEFEDTFVMGSEQTSVRVAPPPPRAVSNPKLRPLPPPAPAKTATDPRMRAAKPAAPIAREDEGSTQIARILTPPTPQEMLSLEGDAFLVERAKEKPGPPVATDPRARPAPPRPPPAPGRRITGPIDNRPLASSQPPIPEREESTRVVSSESPIEDSTRVVGPPPPPPSDDARSLEDSTRVLPLSSEPGSRGRPPPPPPSDARPATLPELGATHLSIPKYEEPAELGPTHLSIPQYQEQDDFAATQMNTEAPSEEPLPESEPRPEFESEPPADPEPESAELAPKREAGNGRTVILGVALGLGLLAIFGAVGWYITHG